VLHNSQKHIPKGGRKVAFLFELQITFNNQFSEGNV